MIEKGYNKKRPQIIEDVLTILLQTNYLIIV